MGNGKSKQSSYEVSIEYALNYSKTPPYTSMEQLSLSYSNVNDFIRENANTLKNSGEIDMRNPLESTQALFNNVRYRESIKGVKKVSQEEAVDTIRKEIRSSALTGWFREYNSSYKPEIERVAISNKKVREAGLNIAHLNYQEFLNEKISFNNFLNSEITVYRGGNTNFTKDDVFISFSYDKKIAEKFGSNVVSQKVKVKDTLGNFQTTGEYEILIPRNLVNTQRGSSQ